ncbi:MAG: cytochrome c peroxidase [Bacteroidota bacterium]
MNQNFYPLILLLVVLLYAACTKDSIPTFTDTDRELRRTLQTLSPTGKLDHYVLPNSDDYANIPHDPRNPLTKEKVELGKMLFFETGLALGSVYNAGRGTYSCATCHLPDKGFMPGSVQGIADGGLGTADSRTKFNSYEPHELDVQGARPLSLLNVAYVTNTSWSGKFGSTHANEGTEHLWGVDDPSTEINHSGLASLEAQNIEGLPLHRMIVNKAVLDAYGYTPLFDAAFPELTEEERYGRTGASFAISAYLRQLFANQSPYQEWLKGNPDAMTDQQKRGAHLFYSKAVCYTCHSGPSLSHTDFYAVGVRDLYQTGNAFNTNSNDKRNFGRGGFTLRQEDMFKFKIPSIYNMKNSPFYFHGSSKHTLREVVEYFNNAIPENPNVPRENLAPQFQPLNLTDAEIDDLTEFITNGLYDPNLNRYVPQEILSGNCFPNADPLSKATLDCN